MTAPVIDTTLEDQIVESALLCECKLFPKHPCDNEFTCPDFLCDECRPVCSWLSKFGFESPVGCSMNCSKACKLIPLLGTENFIHMRAS